MKASQESVKEEMKAGQESVKEEMKAVQASVKDEMKAVKEEIACILENKFKAMEGRMDAVENKVENIEKKVSSVKEQIEESVDSVKEQIEGKVSAVEQRIEGRVSAVQHQSLGQLAVNFLAPCMAHMVINYSNPVTLALNFFFAVIVCLNAHTFTPLTSSQVVRSASETNQANSINSTVLNISSSFNKQVLLSTGIIYVKGADGTFISLRALLDSGSQNNFITKECMELLNLKRKKISASISGINGAVMSIKENAIATIANSTRDFIRTLHFFVVRKMTRITPARHLHIPDLKQLQSIGLANPEFYKPGPIHVLLSNEVFFDLLGTNRINKQDLILQQSVFGYIVSGSVRMPQQDNIDNYCGVVETMDHLSDNLRRFWEIEGVNDSKKVKSQEEEFCEKHFLRTHCRQDDGRYVVEMPIKEEGLSLLGDSRENASKRMNYLLKRFARNPAMKHLYEDFIEEYNKLGHSEEIAEEDNANFSYYLPHHGGF
ncbi:hypothetical protein X975_11948, partial [Stegodyphus mimosarum]